MSQTLPVNRRLSALVALLYVFFSTFGALTHSHVSVEEAGVSQTTPSSHPASFSAALNGSIPAHCPICDWQSLQVVPAPIAAQVVQPVLLRISQPRVSSRLLPLPGFRSSSRGPPLA